MKILITTSGTGSRLGPYTQYTNKSLLKIGDKYAICHIIDLYLKDEPSEDKIPNDKIPNDKIPNDKIPNDKIPNETPNETEPSTGEIEFVITLGYYGNHVRDFLTIAYPNVKFTFVEVDKFEGPESSLGYSMSKAAPYLQSPFIFHCCDALLKRLPKYLLDSNSKNNTMGVYAQKNTGHNYATVNTHLNEIVKINDKGETKYDYLYTGISKIYDYKGFFATLSQLISKGTYGMSLSDIHVFQCLLEQKNTLEYAIVEEWYDTGNIDVLNRTKESFSSTYHVLEKPDESICFLDSNKVVKFFHNETIAKSRYERGLLLGAHVPKMLDYKGAFFAMELINGTVLSEYYKYGEIMQLLDYSYKNFWILTKQQKKEIEKNKMEFRTRCLSFYRDKTLQRIKQYKQQQNETEINTINGIRMCSIAQLIDNINFDDIAAGAIPTQFHGDFILDNIIRTTNGEYGKNKYKFIDWRQDFGNDQKVGDLYYDLAKLRHNIIFNHANIEQGLFVVSSDKPGEIFVDLKTNYFLTNQLTDFDAFVHRENLNLNRIKLLTALVWINMAPLHSYPLSRFLFYFGKFNILLASLL